MNFKTTVEVFRSPGSRGVPACCGSDGIYVPAAGGRVQIGSCQQLNSHALYSRRLRRVQFVNGQVRLSGTMSWVHESLQTPFWRSRHRNGLNGSEVPPSESHSSSNGTVCSLRLVNDAVDAPLDVRHLLQNLVHAGLVELQTDKLWVLTDRRTRHRLKNARQEAAQNKPGEKSFQIIINDSC